jgi:sensor histidine kinase YesM
MKSKINTRRKIPYIYSFLGILAASILSAIFFSEGKALHDLSILIYGTMWSLVVWGTQSFGNAYIISKLDKKWSWLKEPVTRLIIGFLSLISYSFLAIIIVNLSFYWIIFNEFPQPFIDWASYNGKIAVSISLIISTILTSAGFFRSWRKAALQEEQLKVEILDYKYKTLLNQVNPHFLFNSLNVLTSLVYDDQELAVKFIHQLSKIYRYTLENRDRDLVSLKEERSFIDSYVFLLKIRFEEALEVHIDFPEDDELFLLPMALQIILENAIKHNNVSLQKPLRIKVKLEGDYICVSNNLQLPEHKELSTGFGLENIKKRLSFLTDKELITSIEEGNFIAKIPVLSLSL